MTVTQPISSTVIEFTMFPWYVSCYIMISLQTQASNTNVVINILQARVHGMYYVILQTQASDTNYAQKVLT